MSFLAATRYLPQHDPFPSLPCLLPSFPSTFQPFPAPSIPFWSFLVLNFFNISSFHEIGRTLCEHFITKGAHLLKHQVHDKPVHTTLIISPKSISSQPVGNMRGVEFMTSLHMMASSHNTLFKTAMYSHLTKRCHNVNNVLGTAGDRWKYPVGMFVSGSSVVNL